MNCHPLAALFPLMEGKAFQELCDDIRAKGQLVPITMQGNLILDGRNRARACDKLGKPVKQVQFDTLGLTISPEEYIWSLNVQRRHLTPDQLAAIAMQWKPQFVAEGLKAMAEGGKRGAETAGRGRPKDHSVRGVAVSTQGYSHGSKTRKKLADLAGVSENRVAQAEIVVRHSPDLLEEVKAGKVTLPEAVRKVKGEPVRTKRKLMLETSAKRTMIDILSQIRGMCRGLAEINMPALCEACTPDEAKTWANTARESARNLRVFASMLSKQNGDNEALNQA